MKKFENFTNPQIKIERYRNLEIIANYIRNDELSINTEIDGVEFEFRLNLFINDGDIYDDIIPTQILNDIANKIEDDISTGKFVDENDITINWELEWLK
jgi:hypothetical protein